jgi:acylphosphatase
VHEERSARRYYVSGVVQGVGFRYFVNRAALGLGLVGYTRNLVDGRVEVYAVGLPAALTSLRDGLKRGPSGASVERITEEEATVEPKFAAGFSIEYDA